jgi:hypothetical protein
LTQNTLQTIDERHWNTAQLALDTINSVVAGFDVAAHSDSVLGLVEHGVLILSKKRGSII